MTLTVKKSQLNPEVDFSALVAAHIVELQQYDTHMDMVSRQLADPYPPPTAHPLIVAAIRVNETGSPKYSPDFTIEDDLPTEAEVLAAQLKAKQDRLFHVVAQMENAAADAVSPRGKRRLQSILENDVRSAEIEKLGRLRKSAKPGTSDDDLRATVEKSRSRPDAELLQRQDATRARLTAIDRHGAELHSQIEDLTLETIDAWKPEPFPT